MMETMTDQPELSVVIPVFNEEINIAPMYERLLAALEKKVSFDAESKMLSFRGWMTGPEMEAMVGASTAGLTIYDMCKAMDRGMEILEVVLLEKSGGKSGKWVRESSPEG